VLTPVVVLQQLHHAWCSCTGRQHKVAAALRQLQISAACRGNPQTSNCRMHAGSTGVATAAGCNICCCCCCCCCFLQHASLLFFKRFYVQSSCLEHDPTRVMPTCIYLACKVRLRCRQWQLQLRLCQLAGALQGLPFWEAAHLVKVIAARSSKACSDTLLLCTTPSAHGMHAVAWTCRGSLLATATPLACGWHRCCCSICSGSAINQCAAYCAEQFSRWQQHCKWKLWCQGLAVQLGSKADSHGLPLDAQGNHWLRQLCQLFIAESSALLALLRHAPCQQYFSCIARSACGL
jgi:hypothetical protein